MQDISTWKDRYSTLEQYYRSEYPEPYFSFEPEQLEIDVDETIFDIEKYDAARQQEEFMKCGQSFTYFCHKYLKIIHPTRGPVPFILFNFQKECVQHFEDYKYNIIRKFRQGGLTTVAVLWGLWRCMFKLSETIMLLSKSDREAKAAGEISRRAMEHLPTWLRPEMSNMNQHEQSFALTGSSMFFFTPNAARGRALTYLFIDEAAFIPKMDEHWKAMFPTLSTGGSCVAISTVKGVGNWYHETYQGAETGENPFHIIDIHYTRHPLYNDDAWVKQQKAILGEKGWRQEVLGDFLASGSTYIPHDIIEECEIRAKQAIISRKLFPELNNGGGKEYVLEWEDKGALWIFQECREGKEYILAADCAEGVGDEGDNSCFQVIEVQTCEQVAEFYSNCCPTDKFANIIHQIAKYYNHSLVVVENMGAGLAVIQKLQEDFEYDNLYYESVRNMDKPGVRVTKQNRPVIIETIQNRLINRSLPINSTRLVHELKTFIWNKTTQRAEAMRDKHDDAILAMAHAISVRDQQYRQTKLAATVDMSITEHQFTDAFRLEVYEKIKQEILRGAPDDWLDPIDRKLQIEDDEDDVRDFYAAYRPNDALLREFGL